MYVTYRYIHIYTSNVIYNMYIPMYVPYIYMCVCIYIFIYSSYQLFEKTILSCQLLKIRKLRMVKLLAANRGVC